MILRKGYSWSYQSDLRQHKEFLSLLTPSGRSLGCVKFISRVLLYTGISMLRHLSNKFDGTTTKKGRRIIIFLLLSLRYVIAI